MGKRSSSKSRRGSSRRSKRGCVTTARFGLIFLNLIVLILGSGLCYIGGRGLFESDTNTTLADLNTTASGSNVTGAAGRILFEDPYTTLLVIAVFLVVLSLVGCLGTLKLNTCLLITYYSIILVLMCGALYLAIFCFTFTEKAEEYVLLYWNHIKVMIPKEIESREAVTYVQDNMKNAGIVCIFIVIILVMALFLSSYVVGHEYTVEKMMTIMNSVTFVMGLGMIVLGALSQTYGYGGDATLAALVVSGALTSMLSLAGCCGVRRANRCLLTLHWSLTLVLLVALIFAAAYSFVNSDDVQTWVQENWETIQKRMVGPQVTEKDVEHIIEHHLNKIGIGGIVTVVALLFNFGGSLYFCVQAQCAIRSGGAAYESTHMLGGDDDDYDDEEEEVDLGARTAPAPAASGSQGGTLELRIVHQHAADASDVDVEVLRGSDGSKNKGKRRGKKQSGGGGGSRRGRQRRSMDDNDDDAAAADDDDDDE